MVTTNIVTVVGNDFLIPWLGGFLVYFFTCFLDDWVGGRGLVAGDGVGRQVRGGKVAGC